MTGTCTMCGKEREFVPNRGRRCRLCETERVRKWKARNRDRSLALDAAYRARNREVLRAKGRAYAADNREVMTARQQAWREANRDLARAACQQRYAQQFHEGADRIVPLVVLEDADGVCGICGEDVNPLRFDVDHIVPLAQGGLHIYANVQPAHPLCNQRKNGRL